MSNPKINSNKHNTNPERKRPWDAVYVRNSIIHQNVRDLINVRDAGMRQRERAPKYPKKMFESGYLKWLDRQEAIVAGDAELTGNNKKSEEKYEHVVAEKISDHEVTDKPFDRIDLDDEAEVMPVDDFALAGDNTPEMTEVEPTVPAEPMQPELLNQPNSPVPPANVINLDKERQVRRPGPGQDPDKIVEARRLEQIRINVGKEAKSGNEILNLEQEAQDGDTWKIAS